MKCVKPAGTGRVGVREQRCHSPSTEPNSSLSNPELCAQLPTGARRPRDKLAVIADRDSTRRSPRDGHSVSESKLLWRQNVLAADACIRIDPKATDRGDESPRTIDMPKDHMRQHIMVRPGTSRGSFETTSHSKDRSDKTGKCRTPLNLKKSRSCSPMDIDMPMTRQIREIHNDMRASARVIKNSRARLVEIQKKTRLSTADVKELSDRHELLLREMERFDRLTRNVQHLVDVEVTSLRKHRTDNPCTDNYLPGCYESALYHEMKMEHPTVALGHCLSTPRCEGNTRSKSEIDLTRKLSESYDMQEKLVADNADLEVKRYMLYKELMTKDQNLETCRAQIKRLQVELKLMNKENASLHDRLNKNNPEGDAPAIDKDPTSQKEFDNSQGALESAQLALKLKNYQSSSHNFEQQLSGLEEEVQEVRSEMEAIKQVVEAKAGQSVCRGGLAPNTCFKQPPGGGPPIPPASKACGVCPPCPAPCNPNAPPTPAEKEVARLSIQLKQTEENFKTKVTECALLRAELMKKKEELEKERCQHREVQNKLRELEMKFEGLTMHTNFLLGTKEQAFEQEISVRALKQCYREAREEVDDLRTLLKEQNDQLQDYRVKYMAAQQLVEEQKRQMDLMDMDNTRISEQINLEIQRVKLKFQEKLQELAPIPDLLKATQMRLKDAQQAQALAEHNAEQLARELNCAREKVHALLHNTAKPPSDKQAERGGDEKAVALLQQRIAQLLENNLSLKSEIERLKSNVIRLEEAVLANERRLQEKMHECAQLGGELDRTRDEAARAVQRANERLETSRKCLQTTVAELERQLAASRAQVKSAEKERQELQCRMSCQIKRLRENFEQAQLRIMGLTSQVQALRRTTSSTGDGDNEGDAEMAQCQCKTLFDNP